MQSFCTLMNFYPCLVSVEVIIALTSFICLFPNSYFCIKMRLFKFSHVEFGEYFSLFNIKQFHPTMEI